MKKSLLITILVLSFATLIISNVVTGVFGESRLGMFQTMGQPVHVMDVPDIQLITPPLLQLKVGKITLNEQNFYLVLGRESSGRPVIVFDCNGNHNLTDDSFDDFLFYERHTVRLVTHAQVRYGTDVVPYHICIIWNTENDSAAYFGLTRREGVLIAKGTTFRASIAETDSDGIYSKDDVLIMVDLNQNGRFETYEISRKILHISGKFYRIEEVAQAGNNLVLKETEERILVPILGKELTIPDIQLTDYRGNPVTLDLEKWRLVYFASLDKNKQARVFTLLRELSRIKNLHVVALLTVPENGCCPNFEEELAKQLEEIEGVQVVVLNMEEAIPVMEKLSLLLAPEMIMIISPKNELVYRTPVGITTNQPIWHMVDVPLSDPVSLVKALMGN